MKGRRETKKAEFPAGETPVERMERLALQLTDMASDIAALAQSLKEDEDARRADWIAHHAPDAAGN